VWTGGRLTAVAMGGFSDPQEVRFGAPEFDYVLSFFLFLLDSFVLILLMNDDICT
jgi:hypothetical protein